MLIYSEQTVVTSLNVMTDSSRSCLGVVVIFYVSEVNEFRGRLTTFTKAHQSNFAI